MAALGELALRVEHVGSTSVPGLAAKPVVDLDVVIPSRDDLPEELARHVRFRDHLRANPVEAERYAMLKRKLAEQHRFDIDAYCDAKTGFIEAALLAAAP